MIYTVYIYDNCILYILYMILHICTIHISLKVYQLQDGSLQHQTLQKLPGRTAQSQRGRPLHSDLGMRPGTGGQHM